MNKKLVSLLGCPLCKKKIIKISRKRLCCVSCKKYYPVKQDIPVMIDLDHLPDHLNGQIKFFEKSSDMYDTPKARQPWQDKYIERLSQHMRVYKKKVFVDNACGSGYMALMAAKKGAYVLACDLNLSGLVKLRLQAQRLGFADRFLAVCCTAEDLPIRNLCVDAIVSNAILEHLPREREAVEEIKRVTKKNGISMVTVPLAYHLLNPIFLLLNYLYDKHIGHLRRYTKEMLLDRFSNWKLLGVYYTGHTVKVLKTFFNIVWNVFNEEDIEREDEKYIKSKFFASNISVIFRKK